MLVNKFFLFLIFIYQKAISPLLGSNCRFHPTCSHYSKTCFERFSFHIALWYSFKRIIKCHPFHRGGLDEVPCENNNLKRFSNNGK